jgi:hypothetical protein
LLRVRVCFLCVTSSEKYPIQDLERPEAPETLSAKQFHAAYVRGTQWHGGHLQLVLDDVPFHQADSDNLPPSYAEVPVKLDDNRKVFDCVLTAGLFGTQISSSHDSGLSAAAVNDTVQPLAGWWMFILNDK